MQMLKWQVSCEIPRVNLSHFTLVSYVVDFCIVQSPLSQWRETNVHGVRLGLTYLHYSEINHHQEKKKSVFLQYVSVFSDIFFLLLYLSDYCIFYKFCFKVTLFLNSSSGDPGQLNLTQSRWWHVMSSPPRASEGLHGLTVITDLCESYSSC